MIKQIFSHYDDYQGGIIALGAIAYTIQLYCDFSGTMDAVMGVAQIFGVTMPENFQRPFFSNQFQNFGKGGILHSAHGSRIISSIPSPCQSR